jgi:ferredoxin-NADP reductase
MIAGGSGLTPMMQVASRVLADKDDKTQASATVTIMTCCCMLIYS